MRETRSKRNMRRSHHRVSEPSITSSEDGVRHIRHRASLETGKYRGRQVIDVQSQIDKKQARKNNSLSENE